MKIFLFFTKQTHSNNYDEVLLTQTFHEDLYINWGYYLSQTNYFKVFLIFT